MNLKELLEQSVEKEFQGVIGELQSLIADRKDDEEITLTVLSFKRIIEAYRIMSTKADNIREYYTKLDSNKPRGDYMKHLILIFLLAACNATGPAFNEDNIKGNLVVYRLSQQAFDPVARFNVDINGETVCELSGSGYYVTNITGKTTVSSSVWSQPGTSRIEVGPNSYVKIEANTGRALSGVLGGLIAQSVDEAVGTNGPFFITKVPESQAKQELKELSQDCD